jgi:RNA polymerase sigma-70 factor (ECF subfamily)
MHRFDTSRPFGPWIDRIAVNQALNILRARRREVELVGEFPVADLYPEIAERDEVVRALGTLSEEQRLVVVLRYWADMTPSEIAGALDAPVGTVSSRLARALVALRTVFEEVTPQ